ncbi:MAG: hypothetical protein QM652_10925 [Legionella sp.]|uniref:hypothetical protein n=1 Tax=Legionella sp. TaxID=459 RepID=UPI0039E2F930
MLKKPDEIRNLTKLGFELSLFIGFITLNIYFFNIQFFPIVDLYSFAYLAIVVACLGIWIFIVMVLPFSCGPYLWMELLKKKGICELIFKEEADAFINSGKKDFINLTDKARLRLLFYYVGSIIAVYLSLLIIFTKPSWVLGAYFLLGSMMKFYLFNNKNDEQVSEDKKLENSWGNSKCFLILKIYGASIIPGICLLLPTLMLIKFSFIRDEMLSYFFIFTLIFLSGVSLMPLVKNWRASSWIITVSTVVILFSLLCFDGFGVLSKKIVRIYKFGAIENVSIGVDDIGCQIFKKKNPIVECNPKDKVFPIKNVNVLWRVGEYYVEFVGPNRRHEEVILSSTHVYHLDPIELTKTEKSNDHNEKLTS